MGSIAKLKQARTIDPKSPLPSLAAFITEIEINTDIIYTIIQKLIYLRPA